MKVYAAKYCVKYEHDTVLNLYETRTKASERLKATVLHFLNTWDLHISEISQDDAGTYRYQDRTWYIEEMEVL